MIYRLTPCARAVRAALVWWYQVMDQGRVPGSVHKSGATINNRHARVVAT